MHRRILIIEDEPTLQLLLSERLEHEGYSVSAASAGDTGLELAIRERFDLIILDLMLPGKSGLDVCLDLRQRRVQTPILMLTARGLVADKVVGLKFGADDYLTKPFDVLELLARIEALLRRASSRPHHGSPVYEFDSVRVNFQAAEVAKNGDSIHLSALEFRLLKYFIEHRGTVLSRDELMKNVWNYSGDASSRTVDLHILWLRQKLEQDPARPRFLLTVRGMGYKFSG
ncbi:MAG: response regulator transcription factor [Acidobacteria bacterium]|nr:response regulator transcription factor [Acidobacteriota bacterium]